MRKWDKNERRFDQYGEFRLLAAAEDWVLYRRKGAGTGAMTLKKWDSLPRYAIQVGYEPTPTRFPTFTVIK